MLSTFNINIISSLCVTFSILYEKHLLVFLEMMSIWCNMALLWIIMKYIFASMISHFVLQSGHLCYLTSEAQKENCFLPCPNQKDWQGARQSCHQLGGHLINQEDEATIFILKKLMAQKNWHRIWLGGYKENTPWHWTSGRLLDTKNPWIVQMSKNHDDSPIAENSDCISLIPKMNYTWHMISCGEVMGFICEADAASRYCTTESRIFYEIMVIEQRCFMISRIHQSYNWYHAKQQCARYSSKLAEIDTEDIQKKMKSLKPGLGENVQGYWIGATKVQWKWVTGENVTRYHWQEKQLLRNGICMVLENCKGQRYFWANLDCSMIVYYICQFNISGMGHNTAKFGLNSKYIPTYPDERRDYTISSIVNKISSKHTTTQPENQSNYKLDSRFYKIYDTTTNQEKNMLSTSIITKSLQENADFITLITVIPGLVTLACFVAVFLAIMIIQRRYRLKVSNSAVKYSDHRCDISTHSDISSQSSTCNHGNSRTKVERVKKSKRNLSNYLP